MRAGSSIGGASGTGSGRALSSPERDTKRIDQQATGRSDEDEEIGLAPLDEEDVLGVVQRKSASIPESAAEDGDSAADLATTSDIVVTGPGASKSLIEEELHDPDLDEIRRRVSQRAQFNPLQPPGYTPPRQGIPAAAWVLIAVGGVAVIGLLLWLLLGG